MELVYHVGDECFNDMRQDDLHDIMKSHDIGLTQEELKEVVEVKDLELDKWK